jgi:hypothetical protein
MATSFPITLPSTGLRQIRIRQRSVVAVGESPTTLEQQAQRHQGQVWMLDGQYAPMLRASAEALVGALCSLNGREGTFLFGDTSGRTARGVATGTPLVKGGGQTGEDLVTDGWTAGVANILRAGDWVQLGTGSTARLYKQLTDVSTNGSGEAGLALWPRIHTAWADNAPITVSAAKGVFRLTTDGMDWSVDEIQLYGLSISAMSLP